MHLKVRTIILRLGGIALLLSACTLPASYAPATSEQGPAYTSAALTIAAQLTGTAPSGETLTPGETTQVETQALEMTPTETLPATSTPLPTKTPLPSETPTATLEPTETLTPTATPDDYKYSLGDPDWIDNFVNSDHWPIYTDTTVSMQVSDGKLTMIDPVADGYEPWMVSWQSLIDFYLEATFTTGECSGRDRYGLMARSAANASAAYVAGLTCDGQYSLRIWNGARWIELIGWTQSEFINAGSEQTNRLGIRAEGNSLALFINGNLVAEIEDNTFTAGAFGLFISAAKTPGFTIEVSEVAYWELP